MATATDIILNGLFMFPSTIIVLAFRIPPATFRILAKFVYPMSPKSLGMLPKSRGKGSFI